MNLTDQLQMLTGDPFLLFALFFTLAFINVIFPPIPLESATLFGGYLSGTGRVSPFIIVAAAVSGMYLGSLLLLLLVRKYGLAFIARTPLRNSFSESGHLRAGLWLRRYGLWAALFGKFVPGMSLCTIVGFGLLRIEIRKVSAVLFISNLVFFSVLTATGYLLGRRWGNALHWLSQLNRLWLILLAVAAIYGAIRILTRIKRKIGS